MLLDFKKFFEADEPEKIVQTAFYANGQIYPSGPYHNPEALPRDIYYSDKWKDGFLTSKGRFLDREQAMKFIGKSGAMDSSELKSGPVTKYRATG